MSTSTNTLAIEKKMVPGNKVQQVELLAGVEDLYGGIIIDMEKTMDSEAFVPLLRASLSQWKQRGKRAVWIKLPIELANLVEPAVKEGFKYHHAEPDYVMLVNWISKSTNSLPKNASHRVGISAFVMNDKRQVLVVQEKNGKFKGTGVWKFPTGVVDEGEDISMAAIREVKEETGIDTEFVEILAFRYVLSYLLLMVPLIVYIRYLSYAKAHNNLVSELAVMGDEKTLTAKLEAFMEQMATRQQALEEQMVMLSLSIQKTMKGDSEKNNEEHGNSGGKKRNSDSQHGGGMVP
ncbi:hypothetical protein Godav_027266 [Gossypium davidsonii]|uniref:Nudix hydrolase domain-containing protein n=1 Tax=Gossypium davidsonii TaxID=34287 RepID=A0A7J8RVL8_GOSDV|nr:hypothetical protein [Gossypium davidsonii]